MSSHDAFIDAKLMFRQDTNTVDDEIVIAVFGRSMSGAAEFCEVFSKQSNDGECDSLPEFVPRSYEPFLMDGRSVRLVCVPDLDNIRPLGNNARVLIELASFLVSERRAGRRLAGAIYTHPISERGIGASTPRHISMFRTVCGSDTSENVVVATTQWDCIEINKGAHFHEQCHQYLFKMLVEEGAVILKHNDGLDSAQSIVRRLMNIQPKMLHLQAELMEHDKCLADTDIGRIVSEAIQEQVDNRRRRIKESQEEMCDVEQDPGPSKSVEEEIASSRRRISKLEDEIVQLEEAIQGLVEFRASDYKPMPRKSATFSSTVSILDTPSTPPQKSHLRIIFRFRLLMDFFRRISHTSLIE
ncbi:hypothetical protein CERSUDRAFT_89903 [Gelatoporia subvermispora B]|uniref:Uncharacterized protein n=1 Tax=Ceriporiopsis subvermispora (strain B) TaxID=914234 RepID=M2RA87_CERS8|nr:hypothetical protein CERSUDRAFT_89903 [Gelatoporia subvermispora B]